MLLFWTIMLSLIGGVVILPIIAYLVVKFGVAGYFRAKQRENKKGNKIE